MWTTLLLGLENKYHLLDPLSAPGYVAVEDAVENNPQTQASRLRVTGVFARRGTSSSAKAPDLHVYQRIAGHQRCQRHQENGSHL
ncbi:hypothetical protein ON010_g9776 [Phytophthora cinnamomi]|nr:hypothetical protein ON010_g9776 [Phytophthora cinnamomi]